MTGEFTTHHRRLEINRQPATTSENAVGSGPVTALDGETGQVGPQVSERLGIPHATGCEALTARADRLEARRVVEGGYEVVSLPFPALISITETGFTPRYPTWPLRRRAAAADISTWSADDLQIESDRAGLAASPTKVAHMEPVPLPAVTTRWLGTDLDYDQLAGEMHALVRSAPAPMALPIQKAAVRQQKDRASSCPSYNRNLRIKL